MLKKLIDDFYLVFILVVYSQQVYRNRMADYEIDAHADRHNASMKVIEMKAIRNSMINNTPDYKYGQREHHLNTIQIGSRADWNNLDLGFEELPTYVENLLGHLDQGHGNQFGELRVSLLLRENLDTGIHDAICMVYSIPHFYGIDGQIAHFQYTTGSKREQIFLNFFDNSQHSMVFELSEYAIMNYMAEDADALRILQDFFMAGFDSIRYDDHVQPMQLQFVLEPDENDWFEDDEFSGDYETIRIPPPPILCGTCITQLFLRELALYSDDSDKTLICD